MSETLFRQSNSELCLIASLKKFHVTIGDRTYQVQNHNYVLLFTWRFLEIFAASHSLFDCGLMDAWLLWGRTDCSKSIVGTFTRISSLHSWGRIHSLPNTHHRLRGRVTAQAVPASTLAHTQTHTQTQRHVHVRPLQHPSQLIRQQWMPNGLTAY